MKSIKWPFVIMASMAIVGLAGCTTTEGYRQHMSLWEGKTTDSLLIEWGVPVDKATLSDGSELWVYRKMKESTSGGYWSSHTEFRTQMFIVKGKKQWQTIGVEVPFYEPPVTMISRCETRFIVKDGIVHSATFEGNGCVAEEIKKDSPIPAQ